MNTERLRRVLGGCWEFCFAILQQLLARFSFCEHSPTNPKVNENERNEAKQPITERIDEIDRKLRNLSDALRKSHENEREILTWVSDETEKHQPRDGRRISTIKRNMTYDYCAEKTGYKPTQIRAAFLGLRQYLINNANKGNVTYVDGIASVRNYVRGAFEGLTSPSQSPFGRKPDSSA